MSFRYLNEIDAAEVRRILTYDPSTGIFRWRVRLSNRIKVGSAAGKIADGYIRIGIYNRQYRAGRLAYLYMTGDWPLHFIDHRDLNRLNNKWDNLRPATTNQNQANAHKRSHNTSEYKGVEILKKSGTYRARITVNGDRIHLGCFASAEEAHMAYCEAAQRYFGDFAREL